MILSVLENGVVTKTEIGDIQYSHTCDVLVVGAGGAGCYAADSAAREGAQVILCELDENIGGMHVCGNVTGYYYGARGGSYEEDDKKNAEDTVFACSGNQWEQKQIRLVERLEKSGVKILTKHSAIGLFWDGNRVCGICAFDGKKKVNIQAKITVDATSDGHLIRMTDVEKRYGKAADDSFVPFGVFMKYSEDGNVGYINNDSGVMNHYDGEEFSKKTVMAHANAGNLATDKKILNLPLHTGVREGLTFVGEETLDYKNVLLGNVPDRVLFWAYSDLDRHGFEQATEEEFFQNWWTVANLATVTINIPVPLGAVVPKGVRGLVTAGRCLSCDTYTQSAVRMNRDMFRMGECVGVASAFAVSENKDFLDIDYERFLSVVTARGCFNGYPERRFSFDNSYSNYLNKMRALGRTPDKKYQGLALGEHICEPIEFSVEKTFSLLETDAPGVAIWACFLAKDKRAVQDRLYGAMCDAQSVLYRYNCAITLGLLADCRALPVLREIVRNRDEFFYTDNRRSNQFRSAVAICLLGRMGDENDLPLLFEILSKDEIERPMYHRLKANYLYHTHADRNFVYFALFSHACMSIYKIYVRCGLSLQELHKKFLQLFDGERIVERITDKKPDEPAYAEIASFVRYVLSLTDK